VPTRGKNKPPLFLKKTMHRLLRYVARELISLCGTLSQHMMIGMPAVLVTGNTVMQNLMFLP